MDSLLGASSVNHLFVTQQSKEINTYYNLQKKVADQKQGKITKAARLFVISAQWLESYAAYAQQLEQNLNAEVSKRLIIHTLTLARKLKLRKCSASRSR
jgi:poly-D-alanine transfer protein DltD